MAVTKTVKTGVDFSPRINLTAENEVVSALTQIFIEFYYENIDDNIRKTPFSFFAKDLADQKIIDRAAALNVTVRQIIFDGEIIVCDIPKVDTDDAKLEDCQEVQVYAEISYIDSNSKVQKFVDRDENGNIILDADGNECDKFIIDMVKSVTEGWL